MAPSKASENHTRGLPSAARQTEYRILNTEYRKLSTAFPFAASRLRVRPSVWSSPPRSSNPA